MTRGVRTTAAGPGGQGPRDVSISPSPDRRINEGGEAAMSYLMLILEDGETRRNRPAEEGQAAYERMLRFAEGLARRGVLKASDSLKSDIEGVRVRVRGGRRRIVDGPFAESKEIVGGFFLLDCRTKDEAVAIASECPATEWATVEVREIGRCWEGNQ
jgi:hypothetical protein